MFVEGEWTGTFGTGDNTALTIAEGANRITFADFAIAMANGVEQQRYIRKRFSVAC